MNFFTAQRQCLFKDSTFNLMVYFLSAWKIFSNLVQKCIWQVFFYRSHSTGQNTGHCATAFKQDQKCLLALILIQNAVFDRRGNYLVYLTINKTVTCNRDQWNVTCKKKLLQVYQVWHLFGDSTHEWFVSNTAGMKFNWG